MKKVLLVLAIVGMFIMPMMQAVITQPISPPTEKVVKKAVAVRHNGTVFFFDLWMDDEGLVTYLEKGIGIKEEYIKENIIEVIPSIITTDGIEIALNDTIEIEALLKNKGLSPQEKNEIGKVVNNVMEWTRENTYRILTEDNQLLETDIKGVSDINIEIIPEKESALLPLKGFLNGNGWINCSINISYEWVWINFTLPLPFGGYIDVHLHLPVITDIDINCERSNGDNTTEEVMGRYDLSYDANGTLQ